MFTTIAPDPNVIVLIVSRIWVQGVNEGEGDWIGDVPSGPIGGEQTLRIDGVCDVLHHGQSLSPCSAIKSQPQIRAQCLDKTNEQCLEYRPHKLE
jgi:hypothetical protein